MPERPWIFFDVDQTLCDFLAMMRRALGRSLAEIESRWPELAGSYLPEDLERIRNDLAAEYEGRPVPNVAVRRQMFAVVLAEVGATDAEIDDITAYFLSNRFAEPILFDDVRAGLEAVSGIARMGVITNGNSKIAELGIDRYFDEEFVAETIGYAKPDPRIYRHVADVIGVRPAELLMVGDSYTHDVAAARACGWRAVWLRRGLPSEPPDTISSLLELASVSDRGVMSGTTHHGDRVHSDSPAGRQDQIRPG